jgi:DMSO/TMAO reductase YedYZ heme-binding membrane subunit
VVTKKLRSVPADCAWGLDGSIARLRNLAPPFAKTYAEDGRVLKMKFSNRTIRWFKSVVFSASLAPVFMLDWRGAHRHLGSNPIEELTHVTGDWTLRFIVITLLISPLRRLAGTPDLIRFRRMVGLFGFFYGSLHILIYLCLEKSFDWQDI